MNRLATPPGLPPMRVIWAAVVVSFVVVVPVVWPLFIGLGFTPEAALGLAVVFNLVQLIFAAIGSIVASMLEGSR